MLKLRSFSVLHKDTGKLAVSATLAVEEGVSLELTAAYLTAVSSSNLTQMFELVMDLANFEKEEKERHESLLLSIFRERYTFVSDEGIDALSSDGPVTASSIFG